MSWFTGRDSSGRKIGPKWLWLVVIAVGMLSVGSISDIGPPGPPEVGDWISSDGQRLELRDDGTSRMTMDGRSFGARPYWEPPDLRVELADGQVLMLRHEDGQLRHPEGSGRGPLELE